LLDGQCVHRHFGQTEDLNRTVSALTIDSGDGNIQAVSVADDYLFLAPNGSSEKLNVARGTVYVYDLNTTEMIGWMEPDPIILEGDPNGGPDNIGIMDINSGMNVLKRDNGEYLIFFEDDWNTKNLMYIWSPARDR